MKLRIVYINPLEATSVRPRRQTEKQRIHELAMATIAERRLINKAKFERLFKEELTALAERRKKLGLKSN